MGVQVIGSLPKDVELIASTTLAVQAASVSFDNIPQTYHKLILESVMRSTIGETSSNPRLRFNDDAGNNYGTNYMGAYGGSLEGGCLSSGQASIVFGYCAGGNASANYKGIIRTEIPFYTLTDFYKMIDSFAVARCSTTTSFWYAYRFGGHWLSTAAITKITLLLSNFAANSIFKLYGVK